jgi:hypothetical protein
MTSGDFDKQKQEQFEKERPLFQRNHQNGLPQINFFVELANHLSAKTSTQLPIVKRLDDTSYSKIGKTKFLELSANNK